MYAVNNENIPLIEVLMENGADLSHVDQDGRTLIHTAAAFGRPETLQMIISKLKKPQAMVTLKDAVGFGFCLELFISGSNGICAGRKHSASRRR